MHMWVRAEVPALSLLCRPNHAQPPMSFLTMLYLETVSPFSLMGLGCPSCEPRDPPISTHTLALGLQTWDTVPDFAHGFWGLNSGTDAGHTKHLLVMASSPRLSSSHSFTFLGDRYPEFIPSPGLPLPLSFPFIISFPFIMVECAACIGSDCAC